MLSFFIENGGEYTATMLSAFCRGYDLRKLDFTVVDGGGFFRFFQRASFGFLSFRRHPGCRSIHHQDSLPLFVFLLRPSSCLFCTSVPVYPYILFGSLPPRTPSHNRRRNSDSAGPWISWSTTWAGASGRPAPSTTRPKSSPSSLTPTSTRSCCSPRCFCVRLWMRSALCAPLAFVQALATRTLVCGDPKRCILRNPSSFHGACPCARCCSCRI